MGFSLKSLFFHHHTLDNSTSHHIYPSSSYSFSFLTLRMAMRVTQMAGTMRMRKKHTPPTIIAPQMKTQHFRKNWSRRWQTGSSSLPSRIMEYPQRHRWQAAARISTTVLQLFAISLFLQQITAKTNSFSTNSLTASAKTNRQNPCRVGCSPHISISFGFSNSNPAATSTTTSARKVGVRFWQIWKSWEHMSNSYINIPVGRTIMMIGLLQKKEVRYTAGALGIAAAVFGAYKIYQYLSQTNKPPSLLSSNYDHFEEVLKEPADLLVCKEHIPYEVLIEDAGRGKVTSGRIQHCEYLRDIHYRLILSLMKGNSYQGIVNISFWLEGLPDVHEQYFPVNYNGGGVKFVMVNGRPLQPKEVRYENHLVLIPKEMLVQRGKNSIEVIFENLYSFIGNGLCAYFTIDDNQKYSLRQQVIYSLNGAADIEKFMPCLNCLNQCQVRLEVIHPDTFQVFSNTSKSLQRLCSVNEYQKYPFLFDLSSSSLNKSFKLNQSTVSTYTNLGDSVLSNSYSSINYYNRKKANTHFYKQRLPSLHHLFVFSSSMVELQPSSSNLLQSELLLRYFCKPSESHRLARNVNSLHKYILDVFRRLAGENIKDYVNKIDILIIADREVEGHFAPGVILLSEETLTAPVLQIRCLYLIVRALLGLLQLEKGKNVVKWQEILGLNQAVFQRFQQFRNYLFLKNHKLEHLRRLVNSKEKKQLFTDYESSSLKYFSKEIKYLLRQNSQERVSFELKSLMLSFKHETRDEFWQNFLSNFNFLSPLIVQPLIKLGIRVLGVPTKIKILEQLRQCFFHSKYVLFFYTNEEIADDLPAFIRQESYGLQQRLTQIKVKQKFKDFITQRYEKYLPIRSNMTQAESRYIQFKKFNESKNFHHISVLKQEINRVRYFGTKFLQPQRIAADCSLLGWKLLARLKLYPADEQAFALVRQFEGIE